VRRPDGRVNLRRLPRHLSHLLLAALVLLAVFWGCGLIARAYAGPLDLSAVRDVAAWRTRGATEAAHTMSLIGSAKVIFPLTAVLAALLSLRRRFASASLIVVSLLGAAVIENLDKLLVDRPRPPIRHLEEVSSPSFPSGHATQSAAFYGSVLLLILVALPARGRRVRLARAAAVALTCTLVCAIALSRVYLGVHYPTDVAAGLALGGAWTGLVHGLARERRDRPVRVRGTIP
jgi:undecaprenyl-diphosphatase